MPAEFYQLFHLRGWTKKLNCDIFFGGIIGYQSAKVGISVFAVNIGLAYAEHIDIRAVYYKDMHFKILLTVISGSGSTSTVKSAVSS